MLARKPLCTTCILKGINGIKPGGPSSKEYIIGQRTVKDHVKICGEPHVQITICLLRASREAHIVYIKKVSDEIEELTKRLTKKAIKEVQKPMDAEKIFLTFASVR